ncbi:transmembrane 4 L6 family member 4 [Sphaeramia orbicularis]|uniref:transmembrane 4 L6 family member 4 n=1 Tax=Sphaeramia orbicularis TaxID=375764 RepID=UPI00117DA034|nr:transmembrane 4 L6 family member 4-like [Sphaeramia orbicularis]
MKLKKLRPSSFFSPFCLHQELPFSIYGRGRVSASSADISAVVHFLFSRRLDTAEVRMCVSRCLRCVGISLVPMAMACMLSNLLLLFPGLSVHFLLEGHVTREATWATGLWGSGLLVLLGAKAFVQSSKTQGCWAFRSQMFCQMFYSVLCLLAAGFCCLVSATGLVQGPLCLYESGSGPTWGVPLRPSPDRDAGYLYNSSLWSGVCVEPRGVVQWNLVLFSVQALVSGLQVVLCGSNLLNSVLGLILGPGFGHNKVSPGSV